MRKKIYTQQFYFDKDGTRIEINDKYGSCIDFDQIVGITFDKVYRQEGDTDCIVLENDWLLCELYHSQDCCESVTIEDIVGDLQDLVGNPILLAVEEKSTGDPKSQTVTYKDGSTYTYTDESATWSYYKIATIRGQVDIRFYGTSNGYYSEDAQLHAKYKIKPEVEEDLI